jgi:hypothetical protein
VWARRPRGVLRPRASAMAARPPVSAATRPGTTEPPARRRRLKTERSHRGRASPPPVGFASIPREPPEERIGGGDRPDLERSWRRRYRRSLLDRDARAGGRVLPRPAPRPSSFTTVATVPGTATTYTDAGLPTGFPLSYRVQASRGQRGPRKPGLELRHPPVRRPRRVAGCAVSGAVGSLGTSGTTSWSAVPAGNLWFLVTGTWGDASSGPRNGSTPSGQCGNTARSNAASCP